MLDPETGKRSVRDVETEEIRPASGLGGFFSPFGNSSGSFGGSIFGPGGLFGIGD